MSTLDNYGIQYKTGTLKPAPPEGGVSDPNFVTRRRSTGNAGTLTSGFTGSPTEDPATDYQAILNMISMENIGSGSGIYALREENTFKFKSLVAGSGIAITSNANEITITNTGEGQGGEIPPLEEYLNESANFPVNQRDKYLKTKADGTGLEFVDAPESSASNVRTLRLQIASDGKLSEAGILEMPAGWSFVEIPATNIAMRFRVASGESIKGGNGFGFTNTGGWKMFSFSSSALIGRNDPNSAYAAQDDVYLVQFAALATIFTEVNGFVTLNFYV